jgi:ABC-2 type transport system ATP-binding protein
MSHQNKTMTEMTDTQNNAIEATSLALTYPDGTEAVKNVSLVVPEGEFFGFLGPNGAGKTTAIKTIVTLLRPTNGRVEVFGRDVTDHPHAVRERIGYMSQETSIDPQLTARENLAFAAEVHHVPRAERAERIDELLDLVDLVDVAEKPADTFSGGMKKRLDAATALVHDPPMVFLDEPTTGLDPRARHHLWEYFREISDRGTTVFLTTQYLEEADELTERIGVIADGEIIATGAPADLKAEVGGDVLSVELANADETTRERGRRAVTTAGLLTEDETVNTTDAGIAVASPRAGELAPEILDALQDINVAISGIDVRSPTLDDVFLAITGDRVDTDEDSDRQTPDPLRAEAH